MAHGMSQQFTQSGYAKPVVLDNATCIYCGTPLSSQNRTKEHVIGRRFVPTGSLDGQWNLIAGACSCCNGRKADLEDDISAITMAALAKSPSIPNSAQEKIARKLTKSHSRRTGKPVSQSTESLSIEGKLNPSCTVSFGLIGPPQVDEQRAYQLAQCHAMGLFYYLTYNQEAAKGGFWPGEFLPLSHVSSHDWGNTLHRAFMQEVAAWHPRLLVTTAAGHFKAAIRKHPSSECWSWALEWNGAHRLIGFFGAREAAETVSNSLPRPQMKIIHQDAHMTRRCRMEVPLMEDEDIMFAVYGEQS